MKITVQKGSLADVKTQAIILVFCEEEKTLSGPAADIDQKSGGLISDIIKRGDFEAKPSQVIAAYAMGFKPAEKIALVGLGKRSELNLEKIRRAFAKVIQELRGWRVQKAAVSLDLSLLTGKKEKIVSAAVEGAVLGLYRYIPYKTVGREELQDLQELTLVSGQKDYALVRDEVQKAKIIADAVCFARDLVSAPANEMTPSILAARAKDVAKRKNVSCIVLEKGKMKALGMNALLGVAAGSNQPPKLIVLEYRGGKKGAPIALVGKGLTFDSGGISIKPAEKMDEMKTDMAGGAAVLAVIRAAADLKLPVNLVGVVPATENLPGGNALKPGDVLRSHSGRTIEVLNTDAEGRLILADALSYVGRYKPAAIIDIATLTGACIVALGEEVAGMLGTDDPMKKDLREAADVTGELIWELPLWEHYHELIKSDIADYKNSAGRLGGAITGAAFLSKFVGDYPWVHLDIAGPAWTTKDRGYIPRGASGVPVRLLVEFLRQSSKRMQRGH